MGLKRKVTVGYKFYAGAAITLAKFVSKVLRISVGDKTAWEGSSSGGVISINKPELFGKPKGEGGVVGRFTFERGEKTQTANGYLNARIEGGSPANRGVSQLVLEQPMMGNQPYMRGIKVRGERVFELDGGEAQWYPEKAGILSIGVIFNSSDAWKYKVTPPEEQNDNSPSAENYDDATWLTSNGAFGNIDPSGGEIPINKFVPSGVAGRGIWIRKKFDAKAGVAIHLNLWHDDGVWVWFNGNPVTVTDTGNYYHSSAVIDGSLVVASGNVLAVKVLDSVPSGSPTGIYAGVDVSQFPLWDINPAHLIREAIMNTEWGYGYDASEIDDASFTAAADALYDEQFGLSYFWDGDEDLADVLNKTLDHIDGNLYVDYDTLKWTLTLNRKNYDPDTLLELNYGVEVVSLSNYKKPQFLDLVNQITVNYYDLETAGNGTVIVSDSALFLQQGVKVAKSLDYKMINSRSLAAKVAQRELYYKSQPVQSCEITCTSAARGLRRGSVFKLTAPRYGFNQTVMRVTEINRGDGKTKAIKIKCTEDVFDLPAGTAIEFDDVVPITLVPVAITRRLVEEAPYALLLKQYDAPDVEDILGTNPAAGFLRVAPIRPATSMSNVDVSVDAGGGYVTDDTPVDFCPSAKLVAAITKEATSFSITDMDDLDELEGSVLFQIDDEIMAFGALDTGTGAMTLVLRGVWDTLPAEHAADAPVYFIEYWLDGSKEQYTDGETLDVKLLTNVGGTQLDPSMAPVDTVEMAARAVRPYPPANVRFGSSTYYPASVSGAFTVNWAHRNRVAQQDVPLSWKSGSVSLDPYKNTRYTLGFYDATNTLLVERVGIGTPTASVTLNYTGNVTMHLKTVTDDGESYYTFEHTFAYTPPGGSPTNTITADTYVETRPTWEVDGNG